MSVSMQQLAELEEVITYQRLLEDSGMETASFQSADQGQGQGLGGASAASAAPPPLPASAQVAAVQKYRQHLRAIWADRLAGCKHDVETWQRILAVRRSVSSCILCAPPTPHPPRTLLYCTDTATEYILPVFKRHFMYILHSACCCRFVFPMHEDVDTWLSFVSLCRRSGKQSLSLKTLGRLQVGAGNVFFVMNYFQ
jgi:hypothetical protein